jgi:hypothetical protein
MARIIRVVVLMCGILLLIYKFAIRKILSILFAVFFCKILLIAYAVLRPEDAFSENLN